MFDTTEFLVSAAHRGDEGMFALAERANTLKYSGWVRAAGDNIIGKITSPVAHRVRAGALVAESLGGAFKEVSVRRDGVDTFRSVLGAYLHLPPVSPARIAPEPAADLVLHLDGIARGGVLSGWARDPADPRLRLDVDIVVDGRRLGQTTADRLRPDLLKRAVGDGEHGVRFQLPDDVLDGATHQLWIESLAHPHRKAAGVARRTLKTPMAFKVARPWRSMAAGRSPFDLAKDRIIDGDRSAIALLRELLEQSPSLIFSDFGFRQACSRRGSVFPTFRDRLLARAAAWRPEAEGQLIPRFNSKAFTKAYCEAAGIRCPKTMLMSGNADELSAHAFPDRFVIKPTTGSKTCTFLYADGVDLFARQRISVDDILSSVRHHIASHTGVQFIVEELLVQAGSRAAEPVTPLDYEFFTFGGKVRLILVIDRNCFLSQDIGFRQQGWFSPDWQPAPHRMRLSDEEAIDFSPPHALAEMIATAERIGRDCGDFVRVDLYDTRDGPALGEVTIFSHSGLGFTDFADCILSQAWEIDPASGAAA